jgi:hypothetical protein
MVNVFVIAPARRSAARKNAPPSAKLIARPGLPQSGDLVLRGDQTAGVEIVDAVTRKRIAGRFRTIEAAVATARFYGALSIWQESVDNRGRPLGQAYRLERTPIQVR